MHDSVFVYVGDTVVITRWRTSWRDRIIHDTVREHTTDTIIKTETVEKVVETPKSGSNMGWLVATALMLVILGFFSFKVFRFVK